MGGQVLRLSLEIERTVSPPVGNRSGPHVCIGRHRLRQELDRDPKRLAGEIPRVVCGGKGAEVPVRRHAVVQSEREIVVWPYVSIRCVKKRQYYTDIGRIQGCAFLFQVLHAAGGPDFVLDASLTAEPRDRNRSKNVA